MTDTVTILDRLIAYDTVSARSNLDLIDYVEDFLRMRGFAVTRKTDPDAPKAGLFASLGPEGAGVLLSAHTDVVPVEGQAWTHDPFRLTAEGDRLYGRGTTDMKGFLAAMLSVADKATGRALNEPLKLAISYDEEIGCLGIAKMIDSMEDAIGRPRAAIIGEPTEMQVATGHKGKEALRATFQGEAGHSSLAPLFHNALHDLAEFIQCLKALQGEIEKNGVRDPAYVVPYTTLHVGRVSGGTALNIVPDRAEALFEFRHLAADAPDALLARIQAILPKTALLERLNAYPGLDTDPQADVTRLTQRLAGNQPLIKVPYGTEAGHFNAMGIPCVVCGPGSMEGQGHKADEYIERGQLAACDAMLGRLLDELTAA